MVARAVVVERSRALATSSTTHHQEDYTRLGLPTSATLEEVRAAYFTKAKEVHPDLGAGREGEFQEVQEAYRRLVYGLKRSRGEVVEGDPRDDPRCREYWEMRRRCATKEQQEQEQAKEERDRRKEQVLLRRAAAGLLLGVFLGTIFPALFIGQEDYSAPYTPPSLGAIRSRSRE